MKPPFAESDLVWDVAVLNFRETPPSPVEPESQDRVVAVDVATPYDLAARPSLSLEESFPQQATARVEPVDQLPAAPQDARPGIIRRTARAIGSGLEWCFGVATMIVTLAILSIIPILNLVCLGYLLEVSGRIARERRFTAGFIGIRQAARVGGFFLGSWSLLWLLQYPASTLTAARLISPGSPAARGWAVGFTVLSVLVGIHVVIACARGGKLRHFLWPLPSPWRFMRGGARNGWNLVRLDFNAFGRDVARWLGTIPWAIESGPSLVVRGYVRARDAVWDFFVGLRLGYYLWLGARGFFGTLLWLFIPATLLAANDRVPVLSFVGAVLLMVVVLYLPFLQVRFASENRFRALFEVRAVRQLFRRAPIAFWFSLSCTLLFAIPLYLLRIEMPPAEIASVLSLVMIVFLFPTHLLTGWAYFRGSRRELPRHWTFRWMSRLAMLPVVAVYVGILFLTPVAAWDGKQGLYMQHAFLIPVPFQDLRK